MSTFEQEAAEVWDEGLGTPQEMLQQVQTALRRRFGSRSGIGWDKRESGDDGSSG